MEDSPATTGQNIDVLLIDLDNAAKIPAKQRAIKISRLVDQVCSKCYDEGLDSESLGKLVDIITLPNQLDQASIGNLVRNLYPAGRVQDAIVVKVVGSLGHGRGKPSFTAQVALLKWLAMVYEVLENQRLLSQVYGVLFNLLDTITIRPQLCHVLALITRRKHVRTFRIQALMELTRQAGNDPPLVGLMRVYKDFYPDVIVGDVTHGRASVFTHPNLEWRQRLAEIQEENLQRTQDGLRPEQRGFRITRRGINGSKRSKSSVIPEVRTWNAKESSVTLEEIENVTDFVQKLEKIELPNQLVAVMSDPLLQKLLQLKSSPTTSLRVDNWLMAFIEDQLLASGESERNILVVLSAIRDYARYTKEVPNACLKYLNFMMESWNGITGREIILDLLAYTPITSIEELHETVLRPLEAAILDATSDSLLILIGFCTKLVQRWATDLLAKPNPSATDAEAISKLITYTNTLALTTLQSTSQINAYSKVLDFYEAASLLTSQPNLTALRYITIPQESFIYILHFTSSVNIVSRLCGILALYKRAFELAMSKDPHIYPKDYVNRFNGFLMDICNCLWRARAFNTSDVNALGCLLPQNSVSALCDYVSGVNSQLALSSLFSLSYSPVFCLLAISHLRDEEDAKDEEIMARHAGPVTQKSLAQLGKNGGLVLPWPDYRLGVLQYLEKKSITGVGELMYNTMKLLMKSSRV